MSQDSPTSVQIPLTPEEHLRGTWARFIKGSRAQLRQLQEVSLKAFLDKGPEERAEGLEVAGRLADACEAFRLPEVVRLARQFQSSLAQGAARGALAQILVRLSYELERGSVGSFPVSHAKQPQVWLYSNESELQDRLTAAATIRGYQVRSLKYNEALDPGHRLDLLQPDVLVLVIMQPDDVLSLRALRSRFPQVPIAVVSGKESFTLRMEAARASVAAVILREEPLEELFDLLNRTLISPMPTAESLSAAVANKSPKGGLLATAPLLRKRVVVLGDDKSVRDMVEDTLRRENFEITSLDNPIRLLEILDTVNPELVILDFNPELRGLEICRILRTHPRWSSLSIIMLTSSREAQTASLVLGSGADDFLTKPLVGPELTARVANRLQRAMAQRIHGDVDRFTGLAGPQDALKTFVFMTRIAERHSVPVTLALLQLEPAGNLDDCIRQLSLLVRQDMRRVTDQIARWANDVIAVALYDTSRVDCHELLLRLLQRAHPLGELRATLATFPADGTEALHLMQDLEFSLAATPPGNIRSLGSIGSRTDQVAWVRNNFNELVIWDNFFNKRGRRIQWLMDAKTSNEKLLSASPEQCPQVLCLDMDVTFIDAFELLRKLAPSPVRVIAVCNDDVKQIFQAQETGAFDVLTKPIDLALLALRIERALGE